jgi:hypothetical protein
MPIMAGMIHESKRQFWWGKLKWSLLQPLRILTYVSIPGIFIPSLAIPWQSQMFIFDTLVILAFVNTGYVAFIERKFLKNSGLKLGLLWLATISIGTFGVEFIGISIDTLTSFFQQNPTDAIKFWQEIGFIFPLLGGSVLESFYALGQRLKDDQFNEVQKMVLLISLVVVVFFSMMMLDVNLHPKFF